MNLYTCVRSMLLAACLVSPSLAMAGTQIDLPENNCLTWTLVGSNARLVDAPMPVDSGKIPVLSALNMNETPYTPARLGVYLGPASDPPVSIVGQDFRQDLAGKIKYGLYLVSTF